MLGRVRRLFCQRRFWCLHACIATPQEDKDVDVQLLLFESFGGFGKGVGEILWKAADVPLTARPCGAPASLFALGNSQVALLNPIPIIRPHAGCASELSPALGVRLPTALQVLQVLFLEIGIKWGPFQGEQATNAEILRISQPLPLQKGVGGHFIMNEARSQSGMSSSRIIRWLVVQESSFVAIGHAQQARTCANKVVFPRKESL